MQELLEQEREEYRSKPAQSLMLVQSMLGRHRTLTTLHRFYQRTMEQLDGSIFHRFVYRKYVRRFQQEESRGLFHRYVSCELEVPEDLRRLFIAKRILSPPPPTEQEAEREPVSEFPRLATPPTSSFHLSGSDFQILVRGVADALGRQNHLDSLRRGGM